MEAGPENLILIVLDSLRSDDLEHCNKIAPFLTSKGEENLYLENYFSVSPWTAPAHASIITGKLPSEHGTTTEDTYFESDFELLNSMNGRRKVALSENALFSSSTGFSEGFEDFRYYDTGKLGGKIWSYIWENDEIFENRKEKYWRFFKGLILRKDTRSLFGALKYLKRKYFSKITNPGYDDLVFNDLIEELERKESSFVFINSVATHYPYTFSRNEKEEFLANYSEQEIQNATQSLDHEDYLSDKLDIDSEFIEIRKKGYLASIKYVDRKIEKIYQESPDSSVFIVLGDHGELFGEVELEGNKILGHHFGTFSELIEVPCFIFSKGFELPKIDERAIYDHRDLLNIIKKIEGSNSSNINRKFAKAEYYGLKGYYNQFERDYPQELESYFSRKSFSIVESELKLDLTSDGFNYSEGFDKELLEVYRRKLNVLYGHNFEEL